MIVSLSKKFIFIHNPKAAGTSIQEALLPWDDGKRLKSRTKHETLTQFKNRTKLDLRNFFIFGFVRNPWDRFSSFFHFLKQRQQRYPEIKNYNNVNELALALDQSWLQNKYSVKLQMSYFDQNTTIGRYENLERDFKKVANRIGISCSLPHKNKSTSHNYRELYNDVGRKIIEEQYHNDIVRYSYTF